MSGKDPSLSFSRTNDSPVQWIQLLQALDQQGTGNFWFIIVLEIINSIEGGWYAPEPLYVSVYGSETVMGLRNPDTISEEVETVHWFC